MKLLIRGIGNYKEIDQMVLDQYGLSELEIETVREHEKRKLKVKAINMKVKNVSGTSERSCKCGSWIEHWNNFNKGQVATVCRAKGCSNKDIVGAHVKKITTGDNKEYIVPFCSSHNQQTNPKWIVLVSGTDLVPANKQKTCK